MRYNAERKAQTRARVVQEAARMVRADGAENVGVAQVMASAGLTHGGFYAHFASREALVAEAVTETFKDGAGMLDRAAHGRSPREALAAYVTKYLSTQHRDRRDLGCPLPALASELPRLPPDVRARFAEGVCRLTQRLQALMDAAGIEGAEALASSVVAEMVGALSLARALPDLEASAGMLAHSRTAILGRLGLGDLK